MPSPFPNQASTSMRKRVVIVTGAGRGIGHATLMSLARSEAQLLANDLGCDPEGQGADPAIAEQAARAAREQGATAAMADATDLTAPGAAQALVERALQRYGTLDSVIHCAGVALEKTLVHTAPSWLTTLWETHVAASMALIQAATRVWTEQQKPGSVVLSSSPAAFFGAAYQSGSGAAAAAVSALARSAAVELRRRRIRVNAVAPTARTRLTEELALFRTIQPASMTPEHVAPVYHFLASDASAAISGETVGAAGGRVYLIRARETTGAFSEGQPFSAEELLSRWSEISSP